MPASLLSVRLMTIARSLPVLPCQPGFPKHQKNEMGIWVCSSGSWGVGFRGCGLSCLRVPHLYGVPRVLLAPADEEIGASNLVSNLPELVVKCGEKPK